MKKEAVLYIRRFQRKLIIIELIRCLLVSMFFSVFSVNLVVSTLLFKNINSVLSFVYGTIIAFFLLYIFAFRTIIKIVTGNILITVERRLRGKLMKLNYKKLTVKILRKKNKYKRILKEIENYEPDYSLVKEKTSFIVSIKKIFCFLMSPFIKIKAMMAENKRTEAENKRIREYLSKTNSEIFKSLD